MSARLWFQILFGGFLAILSLILMKEIVGSPWIVWIPCTVVGFGFGFLILEKGIEDGNQDTTRDK